MLIDEQSYGGTIRSIYVGVVRGIHYPAESIGWEEGRVVAQVRSTTRPFLISSQGGSDMCMDNADQGRHK